MWILQDWAGNRLTDRKGNSLNFFDFESGWDYIYENYSVEDFQELSIVEELNQ